MQIHSSFDFVMMGYYIFADSLMHRVAAAEMLYVLEPNKKADAVKLIEDSSNNLAPR